MKVSKAKQQQLARAVDCFTAAELCQLAGITEGTEVAWRKRRLGPPHVMLGNSVLYPRDGVQQFLRERIHERWPLSGKSAL